MSWSHMKFPCGVAQQDPWGILLATLVTYFKGSMLQCDHVLLESGIESLTKSSLIIREWGGFLIF